jgi:hypothetical protein
LREYEQAEAVAARALDVAEKHQIPVPAAMCRCVLGQVRAQLGRATEGIALIRKGIAGLLKGSRSTIPYVTAELAVAQEREGAITDALETVEQALQANSKANPKDQTEALWIRGELRGKHGQIEQAEADFRESITLAQEMGAKALELRATTSLAGMLAKHGRRDESRSMLAEIYGWFTEGFDTADLKDAKALLDELAG